MKSAAWLHDEQRTVLEVYSRTHTGLVPDAIQAVLASHDAMLGALERIAESHGYNLIEDDVVMGPSMYAARFLGRSE